jgi:hypothetical protein
LGGEYDGMIIAQLPNDVAVRALDFIKIPTGNFSKPQSIPVMTADEFKGAMEKAKGTITTYATDRHQIVIVSLHIVGLIIEDRRNSISVYSCGCPREVGVRLMRQIMRSIVIAAVGTAALVAHVNEFERIG